MSFSTASKLAALGEFAPPAVWWGRRPLYTRVDLRAPRPDFPDFNARERTSRGHIMTGRSDARDRAAVAATAIVQIIATALRAWFHGDRADFAAVRVAIETLLRDEFHEITRQVRDETRLADD